MKVTARGNGRLVLLFLVAVILPSLALVLFTLRMIGQERELAEKRLLDDRSRLAAEIGRFLLLSLENIKLQDAGAATPMSGSREYKHPDVVLVGRLMGDHLLLPWEDQAGAEAFSGSLRQADFSLSVRSGETEEFKNKNLKGAAEHFSRALSLARNPIQQSYARLFLARAHAKMGETDRAAEQYRTMLAAPSAAVDEYGIHLFLYACRGLLELGASEAEVVNAVTALLRQNCWHSPAEAYLLKDILAESGKGAIDPAVRSAAQASHQEVVQYVALMEQALALQRNYPALRLALSNQNGVRTSGPTWALYGEDPWLISVTRNQPDSGSLLVAVRADKVLESSCSELGIDQDQTGNSRFAASGAFEGAYLGPNFPGVRITFSDPGSAEEPAFQGARRSLYLLLMLVVLSVTLFGSYVVWRDVRRELRTAEMRSQFVSGVSHELKTPLTAIRMFAETLRLGRSRNPEAQTEYLETIVNESERLTRLLNNVLDFSKIEMGRMAYRPKPASLADIIRAAARTIQYPLSQQGFVLNIHIEDGMPEARVDRDAIEQAILNLLSNAMKYSGDARTIELSLMRRDGGAVIRVTDHGVGIHPLEQRKIFDKFYRVSSLENERITGTGLGLALAAHIVKAHGGRIDVESTPGHGSTFSIHLPLESEP